MKKYLLTFLILLPLGLILVASAHGADASFNAIPDPVKLKFGSLADVIREALKIVFPVVGFLAIVVFVIGALRYLVSRGDPKAVDGARGTMTGAVIGLVLVLGATSVSGVFQTIFGVGFFGGPNQTGTIAGNNSFDLRCAFQLTTGTCIGADPHYASFGGLITQILMLLLSIGGIAFFFMLIWGGIRYMSARGDEKAVSSARSTLTSAFIGLLLMISALVIIRLIAETVFKSGSLISK